MHGGLEDQMEGRLNDLLRFLKVLSLVFAALFIGAVKALFVGTIAAVILVVGNASIILGLFPAHVYWTVSCLLKTHLFDIGLKLALIVLAVPPVGALWLAIGIAGCFLTGIGYGYFTPWVATFEAFRKESRSDKFVHCLKDGTISTIKRSCTVVRDFLDLCFHSYRSYLKQFLDQPSDSEPRKIKSYGVPLCFVAGLIGLVVEVVMFAAVIIVKSPYMLFRGWQRLLQDLISREGPFLETAGVPIAGLFFFLWPLFVIACSLVAFFSSFFVGVYAAVIVYQESSFWRGMAYIIAIAADFDEYTNDALYLREGTCLPRPNYRKHSVKKSSDLTINSEHQPKRNSISEPGIILPTLTSSRSVRETIQEVKMVQIWEECMKRFETRGKELIDANVLTSKDFDEWLKSGRKDSGKEIIDVGLPAYSLLFLLMRSISDGKTGLLMDNGTEITAFNRPEDRLMEWFFNPLVILKDQIRAAKLVESELRYLEKLVLMSSDMQRVEQWENGAIIPEIDVRQAEIQAISRRLRGMSKVASKLPSYRRRFQNVCKIIFAYAQERECILNPQLPKVGSYHGSIKSSSSGRSKIMGSYKGSVKSSSSGHSKASQTYTSIEIVGK